MGHRPTPAPAKDGARVGKGAAPREGGRPLGAAARGGTRACLQRVEEGPWPGSPGGADRGLGWGGEERERRREGSPETAGSLRVRRWGGISPKKPQRCQRRCCWIWEGAPVLGYWIHFYPQHSSLPPSPFRDPGPVTKSGRRGEGQRQKLKYLKKKCKSAQEEAELKPFQNKNNKFLGKKETGRDSDPTGLFSPFLADPALIHCQRPERHGQRDVRGRCRLGVGSGEVRRGREREDHLPRGQRCGQVQINGTFSYGRISKPQQLSTFALTLYKYTATVDDKTVLVDFWDTAGQERFQSMHASYYHKAHACIMVFDVQRKVTYKNLSNWYKELREFRPQIPCIVVANKIDADLKVTQKSFSFPKKLHLPFYFVSAADGTNVVKLFNDAIKLAVAYKQNSGDFMDEVLKELENFDLEKKEEEKEPSDQEEEENRPEGALPST